MIAGANGGNADFSLLCTQLTYGRQRTSGLKCPRTLKKLELAAYFCGAAHEMLEACTSQERRLVDCSTELLAQGLDVIDGRRLNHMGNRPYCALNLCKITALPKICNVYELSHIH